MIKKTVFILTAVLCFVGCDSQDVVKDGGAGLKVDIRTDYACELIENSFAGRASFDLSDIITLPTEADFSMELYTVVSGVESLTESWESAADFPSASRFSPGAYRLEVSCGSNDIEGENKPYFYGTTSFELVPDDTLKVSVEAELNNSFFLISCTDLFKEYFSAGELTITSSEGGELTFAPLDSSAPLFVKPGNYDIVWSGTRDGGKVKVDVLNDLEVVTGTGYSLTLDVDAGSSSFVVYYDDEIVTKEMELVVSTDPIVEMPMVTASGFTPSVQLDYSKSATTDAIQFDIFADGQIADCIMKFSASAITALGCDEELSLVSSTNQSFLKLHGMEIKGLDKNREKMAYIKMNSMFNSLSVGVYTFTVNVVDVYGRTSSNCVLKVNIVE